MTRRVISKPRIGHCLPTTAGKVRTDYRISGTTIGGFIFADPELALDDIGDKVAEKIAIRHKRAVWPVTAVLSRSDRRIGEVEMARP